MRRKILFSILWLMLLASLTDSYGQSTEQARLVVQTGHSNFVSAVAFSPDGRMLASGALYPNRTIKLWDIRTGRELRSLAGHRDDINTLVFSPNGEILASAGGGAYLESGNYTVRLWEVASGKLLGTLEGNYPVFSPDGKTLAYAGERIKLWSITERREEKTIDGDYPLGFRPDGTAIIGIGAGQIKTWDARTGAELSALPAFSGDLRLQNRFVISSNGALVATTIFDSSPRDKAIKTWDVLTGRVQLIACGGPIAFTPDSKGLACRTGFSRDGPIGLWDLAAGKEVRTLIAATKQEGISISDSSGRRITFVGPAKLRGNLAFSPDGRTIASGIGYGAVGLWDTTNTKAPTALLGHAVTVPSLAFSHDGRMLATGGGGELWGNNAVKLWDLSNNGAMRAFLGHKNSVNAVVFSSDDKTLASGSSDQEVKLWNVSSGAAIETLVRESNVNALALSADGKLLAAGRGGMTGDPFNMGVQVTVFSEETNLIDIWEVSAGKLVLRRTLPAQRSMVHAVAFSPDAQLLLSGTGYSFMETTLWRVSTGEKILNIPGLGRAFSPDGKLLAVESDNNTVELRDSGTGALVKSFGASSAPIAFSRDGRILALAGQNDSINLYDLASGAKLRTLEEQSNGVRALAFSPDDQVLASSANNGTRLWQVASGKELAALISLDKEDWAVVTPDGRWDASPGAQELMHYVLSTKKWGYETISLSQLKQRYYEPRLLQKLLGFSKEPLRDVSKFENPKLNPDVKYEPFAKGGSTFTVTLTNRGGGIGRVQVFVNGKEFLADARNNKLKQNPNVPQAMLNIDLSKATGAVTGRDNDVKVVAWNVENYISSRGAELLWTAGGLTDRAPPEVYAIVGGISSYAGSQLNLNFAAKDAVDIANAIELGAKRLFGADRVHMTLLTTADDPRAIAPTKENFTRAFEMARKAKPTDILIVYLAGHGITLQGGSDMYCYLTQEARTTDTAALSDSAVRKLETITSEELVDWIKQIPALKQVVMLDTCAAGAAQAQLKLVDKREASGDAIRAIDRAKDRTGSYILMGSAADAVSYEASQYGQGLLTYALLKGMKGAALNNDEFIDVAKLFQYARNEVEQLARNIGGIQRPIIFSPKDDSFEVGQLKAEDKQKISLAAPKPLILRPNFQDAEAFDDTLLLMKALRARLRDESFVTARGASSSVLVFVDDEEFPGGIRPTGRYTVTGNKVTVTLRLRRDGAEIGSAQVITGTKDDVPGLAVKVLDAVKEAVRKL